MTPEKKKKQPPRRRQSFLASGIVILAIVAAGFLFKQWWQQYSFYQRALAETAAYPKFAAPDGTRFVGSGPSDFVLAHPSWIVNNPAGRAYYFPNPDAVVHGVHWSPDSRYVAINNTNHYGADYLLIFDTDAWGRVSTGDYPGCGYTSTGFCVYSEVIAVAPQSPRLLTADGTIINLPDGSYDTINVPGMVVQAFWSADEAHLFTITYNYDEKLSDKTPVVAAFSDGNGKNPVTSFSAIYPDGKHLWFETASLLSQKPDFCHWNADETGVECVINGQVFSASEGQS